MISNLKTCQPIFPPWSLDLFICVPFQLHAEHTALQPFWRIKLIVHIAIPGLPGTHLHLSKNPAPSVVRNRTAGIAAL